MLNDMKKGHREWVCFSTGLTVPTIYSKVSKGELPVMKRSKRLYFSSTELMKYLKRGRKKSNAEIEQEAKAYLS